MNLRISTTTLESFRLWSQPEQDWMTEDELIATIKGEFRPTAAVQLGYAFGKVLETPERYETTLGYVFDDAGHPWYQFDRATIDPCLAVIDRRGVFEVKGTKTYGDCTVVAKADFDKYAQSCQWRFMVDIFDPLWVTYHVFLLNDHENGVAELRGIESFNLYPYDELHEGCCELVARFKDYVTLRGLDGLLRERQAQAAA